MTPAEEAILGAAINASGACLQEAALSPTDFSTYAGEALYGLITDLFEAGARPDLLVIADTIRGLPADERRGFPDDVRLHVLSAAGSMPGSVTYHAAIVANDSARRRLLAAGQKLAQDAAGGAGVDVVAEQALEAVGRALAGVTSTVEHIGATMADTINSFEDRVTYAETPWAAINHLIQGWRPGGLYVIGARPSVGKTVAGLQAALSLVNIGPVAFISLEMSEKELQTRMISHEAKVDISHLTQNRLTNADNARMAPVIPRWDKMPLFIDKTHATTFAAISRHAWSVKRKHGLAALVIDYVQLMESTDPKKREYEVVTENSRKLKLLAQQLNVPVIALSQLNRGSEQRESKRPQLSDLRASGAIEQDADVVILLHRDLMKDPSEMELIVAKNRHGVTGIAEMDFVGHYSEIRDRRGGF